MARKWKQFRKEHDSMLFFQKKLLYEHMYTIDFSFKLTQKESL